MIVIGLSEESASVSTSQPHHETLAHRGHLLLSMRLHILPLCTFPRRAPGIFSRCLASGPCSFVAVQLCGPMFRPRGPDQHQEHQNLLVHASLHNAFNVQVRTVSLSFLINNRLLCITGCLLFPCFLTVSRYDIRYDQNLNRLENEKYSTCH